MHQNLSADRVEQLKHHLRLSYRDLSKMSGVPATTIRDYVNGRCTLERRPDYKRKLATAFERPIYINGLHDDALTAQIDLVGAAVRSAATSAKVALDSPESYSLYLDALSQDTFATYVASRKNGRISDWELARSSELKQYEDVVMVSEGRKTIEVETNHDN